MTVLEALRAAVGDPARFRAMRERVEILVENQANAWVGGTGGWLVVPLRRRPQGFYLVSEDREGQRRGREVLQAFLGPAAAAIETVPFTPTTEDADRALQVKGLVHLSYVRRVIADPGELLDRLEDAVTIAGGRDVRSRAVRPSHVDLLRDFRLALLQRDGRLAERALDALSLTGQLSAENLRFLRVELLGRLERWGELRDLPYLAELLRARRPRTVNEVILEMLWQVEVTDLVAGGRSPQDVHAEAQLGARYGAVLGAVDVPTSAGGRAVVTVDALVRGDTDRLRRLLDAADDDAERERLQRLVTLANPPAQATATLDDDVRALFEDGQDEAVIRVFLDSARPEDAEYAVRSVRLAKDSANAPAVLDIVQRLLAEGRIAPDRRLRGDIEELKRTADNACGSWVDWCSRVRQEQHWPEAEQVLRSQHTQWLGLRTLGATDLGAMAEGLLEAWTGANRDQATYALDLLCRAAAETASVPQATTFCDAVLMVLAEQDNLSEPVREAYLGLLDQLLLAGPGETRYRELVGQAAKLWLQVNSAKVFDWGLGLVEVLLNAPAPDPNARVAAATEVLARGQEYQGRLNQRQRSEWEALAEEIGLPVQRTVDPEEEADSPWRRLDGRVVGVYSLLPRAEDSLRKRLTKLCSPKAIEGNADKVATSALQSLAAKADYLIVDTWHAAHAATGAIDAVRSRDRQIMPRGRGITGFIQALEESLTGTAISA